MKDENINKKEVSEPKTEYETPKTTKGIGKDFDFEKELAKSLTIDEARKLSKKLLDKWWMEKV